MIQATSFPSMEAIEATCYFLYQVANGDRGEDPQTQSEARELLLQLRPELSDTFVLPFKVRDYPQLAPLPKELSIEGSKPGEDHNAELWVYNSEPSAQPIQFLSGSFKGAIEQLIGWAHRNYSNLDPAHLSESLHETIEYHKDHSAGIHWSVEEDYPPTPR